MSYPQPEEDIFLSYDEEINSLDNYNPCENVQQNQQSDKPTDIYFQLDSESPQKQIKNQEKIQDELFPENVKTKATLDPTDMVNTLKQQFSELFNETSYKQEEDQKKNNDEDYQEQDEDFQNFSVINPKQIQNSDEDSQQDVYETKREDFPNQRKNTDNDTIESEETLKQNFQNVSDDTDTSELEEISKEDFLNGFTVSQQQLPNSDKDSQSDITEIRREDFQDIKIIQKSKKIKNSQNQLPNQVKNKRKPNNPIDHNQKTCPICILNLDNYNKLKDAKSSLNIKRPTKKDCTEYKAKLSVQTTETSKIFRKNQKKLIETLQQENEDKQKLLDQKNNQIAQLEEFLKSMINN